jgi:hypothetical protein
MAIEHGHRWLVWLVVTGTDDFSTWEWNNHPE